MELAYLTYKGFSVLFSISGFLMAISSILENPYKIILLIISILGMALSGYGMILAQDACEKAGLMWDKKYILGRLLLVGLILSFTLWVCFDSEDVLFKGAYCGIACMLVFYIMGPNDPKEKTG